MKHIIDTRKKGDRIRKQEIFYDSSCRNTSVRKEISRQFVCRLYLGVPRGWSICNLWFAKFVPFFAFLITINIVFQLHTTLPCFREVHQTNIMECNHKYHSVLKGGGSEKCFFLRQPKVCFGQLGQVIGCSTLGSTFE